MKKVAIMCRVSSDEQAKGYSLDDQLERLSNYCERMNYQIVYTIKEDHSAKSFDRPEWNKLMGMIKSKELDIDQIIFTSWDRFSRNLTQALNMIERLRKIGITPQSAEQPIDYAIPESLFMLAIYLTNPDVDNQRRAIKIKGGIRKGLSMGYYPMKAFFGYKSTKNEAGRSVLIPDPQKAQIVQSIFNDVESGVAQSEIRTQLAKQGIVISRNNMSKLLKRITYTGKIIVPAHEKEPMRIIEGIHEPLISEQQFYRVQQTLRTNKKARGKSIPKYAKLRDDFHLRGVLQCSKCNSVLTSSYSKGKLGTRYGYYHCNSCKQERVSANKVHDSFSQLLQAISIDQDVVNLFNTMLEQTFGADDQQNANEVKKLKVQLDQIEERVERSQDLMLDGKLDPDEYVNIKTRLSVQTVELNNKISQLKTSNNEIMTYARSGMNLLANITETYSRSSIQMKHKIVGSIFPNLLSFDGKNCRTPKLNSIFALFASVDQGFDKMKKGQLTRFCQLSPSAERGGFEPPLRFRKHAFQACAFSHSATSPIYFNRVQPPDNYRDCHLSNF